MAKQSLFEAVASAMSKANHARDELRNLDQRAWKMQATPKSWAKNADRFNSRAAALEAKMHYNDLLSNKLRGEALENVNRSNAEWNRRLNDVMDNENVYINLDELAETHFSPRIYEDDARRVGRMSGVDDVDRKSVKEIADEMYDSGLYPILDIGKLNITGSSSIDDVVPEIPYSYIHTRSGKSGWDAARDGIKQFREYNTKPVWTSDLLKFRNGEAHAEDALREYQKSGPRYRK